MKESTQINCSCYGPVSYNQEKFFLTRKRDTAELEPPLSVRRVNKSAEVKADSECKNNKKSLKKRPGSAHQQEHPFPINPNDLAKNEVDSKFRVFEQIQPKSRSFWGRGHQTPSHELQPLPNHCNYIRFPETTANSRPATLLNSHFQQHPSMGPINLQPYVNIPRDYPSERSQGHLRPQLQQFYSETMKAFDQQAPTIREVRTKGLQELKGRQVLSKQTLIPHDFYYSAQFKPNQNIQPKEDKQHTETWNIREEDLIIDGFDRLFKDKEQYASQSTLNKEQKHPQPKIREVQKSKRLEKQALFGRFAQSDEGESESESSPSEVIGRGFDRTYQDLLDEDNGGLQQSQTKASRSTNTKVSGLQGQKRLSENWKGVFGNSAHFKSYKFL